MFVKSHTDETKNKANSEIHSNKSSFALAFYFDKRRRRQHQQQRYKYFNIIFFVRIHTNTTASATLRSTHSFLNKKYFSTISKKNSSGFSVSRQKIAAKAINGFSHAQLSVKLLFDLIALYHCFCPLPARSMRETSMSTGESHCKFWIEFKWASLRQNRIFQRFKFFNLFVVELHFLILNHEAF